MTVSASNLTSGRDATDATSYATAAITAGASTRLVLVTVFNSKGSAADTPTISGGGLSAWVQVDTLQTSNRRITLFRGMGTPGAAAAITIDFAGATQTSCAWSVDEFSNVDTTGTNGSGAVVQSATNSGSATSGSVTLAAFGSSGNATFGSFGHNANEANTPGSGFTELADQAGANPTTALETEWRSDNDTSVDASWSTSATWLGVAAEIKAAASVTGNGTYPAHLIQFAPGIASSAVPSSGDWVDITPKVFEWSTKWGTENEFTQPSAGDSYVLLNNSDGIFDPDNSSGTYYGQLLPGMWFRILGGTTTANADVFYGQVTQDGFQVGAKQYPDTVVSVRLVDVSEFLSNVDVTGSVYGIEVMADTPALWWRLGESSGTVAADSSGNGRAGTYSGGATANSATGLLANDSNTAIHFDGVDDKVELSSITLGANFTIEMWVQADASLDPTHTIFLLEIGSVYDGIQLKNDAAGGTKLIYRLEDPSATPYFEYTSTADVFDGQKHHVVITQSGSTTSLYVDNVEGKTLTTGSAGGTTWTARSVKLAAGEVTGTATTRYLNGVIDEFAIYTTALSSGRVAAHFTPAPWEGDLTSTRLGRILDNVGYDATQRNINTGNSTMQAATLSGDAWSNALAIAKTENGSVYVDHQNAGKVTFINRQYRWSASASLTSQVTIGDGGGAEVPPADIDLTDDRIINSANMQRTGGDPVLVEDASSKTTYRKRSLSETGLLYETDAESTYRGQRIITEKKDRHRRVRSVALEPRKSTHPAWSHVFARKVNDRITVKWRPTYGGTRSYDCWIIGIKQEWRANSGLRTVFFLAPVPFDTAVEPYWIAGTSTAGVTTRPGY